LSKPAKPENDHRLPRTWQTISGGFPARRRARSACDLMRSGSLLVKQSDYAARFGLRRLAVTIETSLNRLLPVMF
jgi:hypothetical protein